jgi:hypothetical protein
VASCFLDHPVVDGDVSLGDFADANVDDACVADEE